MLAWVASMLSTTIPPGVVVTLESVRYIMPGRTWFVALFHCQPTLLDIWLMFFERTTAVVKPVPEMASAKTRP